MSVITGERDTCERCKYYMSTCTVPMWCYCMATGDLKYPNESCGHFKEKGTDEIKDSETVVQLIS